MKKNLVYQTDEDTAYMTSECLMEYRVKHVTFTKKVAEGSDIVHKARADLFGLYYMADPKLVELGIMPNAEASS